MSKEERFEPTIIAFCCNECAYGAADLAGISRMQSPPNIQIVRIPCTGKIDMIYIISAFEEGADGVFVAGCLKEQCHYIDGNLNAEARIHFLKEILDALEFGGDRLEMYFMSAAMSRKFVETANEFTERIRKLGPNPHFP